MAASTLTREEILAANILPHRSAPERDGTRESRALDELIGRINGEPGKALQALVEETVALTGAGSAGVSILTDTRRPRDEAVSARPLIVAQREKTLAQ